MWLTPNDFDVFYDAPPKLNFSFQVFNGSLHWGVFASLNTLPFST